MIGAQQHSKAMTAQISGAAGVGTCATSRRAFFLRGRSSSSSSSSSSRRRDFLLRGESSTEA
jgi:hypothetical protein